jgi:hypothetical protein
LSATQARRFDRADDPARRDVLARWAEAIVESLGAEVLVELAGFAKNAGPGSMMTIRCTRDGYTSQVTGPIVGGRVKHLSDDVVVMMDRELTSTNDR